jgi:hypothetical protein
MEVTSTRISVSSIQDVYPGTQERIVLISGDPESVNKAQGLLWDLIGFSTASNGELVESIRDPWLLCHHVFIGDKSVPWSPRAAQEDFSSFEGISVTGKITISASAGGLMLGKGGEYWIRMTKFRQWLQIEVVGATFRTISEESRAHVVMNSKEDALFTHVRVPLGTYIFWHAN